MQVCLRKDHLSGSSLSIYLPIYCVLEENQWQPKDTVRYGALDIRNWAIFHEPPKSRSG
jgi:hypothetical protein